MLHDRVKYLFSPRYFLGAHKTYFSKSKLSVNEQIIFGKHFNLYDNVLCTSIYTVNNYGKFYIQSINDLIEFVLKT